MDAEKEFLIKLGKKVEALRKAKGLTQLDLALSCGKHAEQIGRLERGERNCTILTLVAVAEALEVPLQELIDC